MNLKKRILACVALLCTVGSVAAAAEKLPEFKDKSVLGVNRLDGRSTFWYYTSKAEAQEASYLKSPNNISLNGKWSFHFCEKPADKISNFYEESFDTSKWDKIDVPGSWPLQGYDKPMYMNHPYEFNIKNPFPANVPDDWNPVGAYRRSFTVPADWKDKRVVLHFGAVKSSFYVWVNGKMVGYSQDSKMQAEFDITPYIKAGEENSVSLEVYRFSIGSYLEGQDMWRLAGIKRDVWVYATDKNYVADFFASTSLENGYKDGVLDLTIETAGAKASKGMVEVELISPEGKSVLKESAKVAKDGSYKLLTTVAGCQTWSDEHPDLYSLVIKYTNGADVSYVGSKIGFRSVELKNSQVLINGKPIRVRGVNRHEHHPVFGHYIPVETIEKDIEMMKRLNVNAIRTSHYPQDPYMYELCDKYGIFICSEANVETHGLGAALQAYYDPAKHIADDPSWESLFHDRIFRMFERDKNHPSILFWSMGNECGDGVIFRNGYKKLKETDPSRLVIFEQAGTQSHTDVVGPMYMTMDKMRNYAMSNDTYRPLILCEYQHAMGNSLGDFADYWELIDSYDNLQGGFIWDWVDQGLEDFRDGVRFLDYGGAFGMESTRNDGAFCLNGILNSDREPNPHAYEMNKVYDNIDVRRARAEGFTFTIRNKYNFTNLSYYNASWSLMKDGEAVESGELKLDVAPGVEKNFELKFKADICDGHEYMVNFEFKQPEAANLIPKGHVVAYEQIALSKKKGLSYEIGEGGSLVNFEANDVTTVKGDGFAYGFCHKSGRISSIEVDGVQFLKDATEYDFHRVPVDNDGWDKDAKYWATAEERVTLTSLVVLQDKKGKKVDKVTIIAESFVNADTKARMDLNITTTYTVYSDGTIEVDNKVIPVSYHAEQTAAMPRLGERYVLRGDLSQTEWYGRGPWENYADRKTSAIVGKYSMPTKALEYMYTRPQENGYRTDVREVEFSNGEGVSITITGRPLICFGASYAPKENYVVDGKAVRNTVDVKYEDNLYLNIDYGQKGVGGDNSWGNPVHIDYRVLLRTYHYGYFIKPSVEK